MKKINFDFKKLILIPLCFNLQSCMDMAVTGAQAIYNKNSIQATLNDQYVTMKVNHALFFDSDEFKSSRISISTVNQIVILTGQTPTAKLRKKAGLLANNVMSALEVHNFITVGPALTPTQRATDTWITTKIKTQLIADDDSDPSKIKVITDNRTVYLIGLVFPEQAKAATEIARSTEGVEKVVRIFTYLKISKTI